MRSPLLIITLLFFANSFSQSYPFKIAGVVKHEKEKNPIESATIHLERAKDSSVISYTISDKKGKFSLEGKSFFKNVRLYISFIGLKSYKKEIELTKQTINLGTVTLAEENMLDEIIIKSRSPITIKKDTLEFNVESFKTKKDANVEDLLKKLPGIEVDAGGKISVNGKPVNKILVNGKPFFGNDPTITTRNLTKDIIEKVQITDTKSKSEAFTGKKGDKSNKTINLTIKEENNKGWFGRVSVGIGTKKHYEGAAMVNRFNNDQRLSILASTNNINSPGFSFGEIQKMYGGGGGNISFGGDGSFVVGGNSFGGGQGIVTSKATGATYADEYGKGFDVNANYFFSNSTSENTSKNNRTYTLSDRKYATNSNSNATNSNDNHNIRLETDIEVNPTFLINIAPEFSYNKRNEVNKSSEKSLDAKGVLTNSSNSNSRSNATTNSFKNSIEITKRLGTSGSFLMASIENQIDKSGTNSYNNSKTQSFGTNASTTDRNQHSDILNNINGFNTSFTYRLPLISEKLFIDASYQYENREEKNKNNTFDFNPSKQKFSNFNTKLSSNFIYKDITKIPEIGLEYNSEKWQLSLKTGYVNRMLSNTDKLRPKLSLSKNFSSVSLSSDFEYRFASMASISFNYKLNNNAPALGQVQPFENVSNPLNITKGNPNLSPTQEHRIYMNFHKFNWQAGTGMFFYVSGSFYNNQIVPNTEILPDLTRKSTYTNTDGGYSFFGGGSYNKKVKLDSISNVRFRIGANIRSNKDISILNNKKNISTTTAFKPSFGITYEIGKTLRITPRYEVSFSNTKYNTNNLPNQNFTRHSLRIRTRTNFPKKLEWMNDIRYTYNPNIADGFNKNAWFWNATLAYSVFKDKATITLKAYDLLNQNTNATRKATQNYIEDAESSVLTQYFMLGFNWKFNSLGKRGNVKKYELYH